MTPTVKRVKTKCDKFVETQLQSGQLARKHLETVLAYKVTVKERNDKLLQITATVAR